MSLWGIDSTGESAGDVRPLFLHQDMIRHRYSPNKCYANMSGWTYLHQNGTKELLVAVPGLSNALGNASIVGLEWGNNNFYGASTETVVVVYNEALTVVGHPTLVVTGSTTGAITATHTATNTKQLVFTFTVPDGVNQTFTVAAQSIGLNGGTINDADGDLATSSVVITAPVAAAIYPMVTETITMDNPVSVVFPAATFVQGAAQTVTLNYASAVTVAGGTPTVSVAFSGAGGAVTASYASGTGTTALVFNFTVPSATGNITFATQTISGTGTLKDANGSTVNKVISAGIASAAGSKSVA